MKHLRGNPSSLFGVTALPFLAAAVLTMAGWSAASVAQTSGTSDKDKSSSDDLKEIVIVSYRITRGSVGSLVDAAIEDVPRNMVAVTAVTLEDQMVSSTLDILKNFPGVQRGSDSPGYHFPCP